MLESINRTGLGVLGGGYTYAYTFPLWKSKSDIFCLDKWYCLRERSSLKGAYEWSWTLYFQISRCDVINVQFPYEILTLQEENHFVGVCRMWLYWEFTHNSFHPLLMFLHVAFSDGVSSWLDLSFGRTVFFHAAA